MDSTNPSIEREDAYANYARKRIFWGRAVYVALLGVIVPPLLGVSGTVVGMIRSFNQASTTGTADPATLSEDVSSSLYATAIGLVISGMAFLFFLGALFRFFQLRRHPVPNPVSDS